MKDLSYYVESAYGDQRMNKYFEKNTSEYVVLDNDCCLVLFKQHIEKDFCFGYYYDASEVDGCEEVAKKDVEYFLERNRRNLFKKSEKYVAFQNYGRGKMYYYVPLEEYQDAERRGELFLYGDREPYFLNDLENERLNNAIDKANAKFEKRLSTYLKKYGLSKVNTWTFWANE
jgi:hypothetical protein